METCRTCAKCDFGIKNDDWLDLFHPVRWAEEIAHVRNELSDWKLKVTPNDGLPQKICTDCFTKFCDVYAFRMECQQAQIKLSNIFDKIEEQCMESGDDDDDVVGAEERALERQCADLMPIIPTNDVIINNEDTLLGLFELNSPNILNASINELNATLEQSLDYAEKVDQITKTVSNDLSDTTIAAVVDSPLPNTAVSNKRMNESLNLQQHLDEIQKNFNNVQQLDHDHAIDDVDIDIDDDGDDGGAHFNNIIEEVDNDDEIERFSRVSLENLIEIDEGITPKFIDVAVDESTMDFSLTFECKYCYKSKETHTQSFATQHSLLTHIARQHDAELPFSCPHCQFGFRDAASRTVHIKDKHVEKHHVCNVCGKKYADRCNLRHHVEKYHSENDFECTLCEKRFYSRKSLKYHMKWHDPDLQLKCNYCDRLFINQRHLQCHEATHTGLRNCEYCSFCGKSFIHLKTLRWHLYRKHGGEKPYKCSNCTEAFTSYREKRIHMLEYHLENLTTLEKSECMLCHKHFDSENELKHHMTDGHKPTKSALVIADNKRVLQNKRRKSFNGIFQCEVCSQRFNMKTALERHMNVHSVEGRPHACPQCPKRFKRIQDMNWHMKTHSNDKTNICDVCGKGFALKYVLTQHQRSHEVLEKNFQCATCGRAYLFEKSLRVHERVHTGKTYYKCDLCNESFVTHIKLRYHLSKKHTKPENIELPLDELENIVIPGN